MVISKELCVASCVKSFCSAKGTFGFNNQVFLTLLDSFIQNTSRSLEEIALAKQEKNRDHVKVKMHGLRGILASLHVQEVANMCQQLEYSNETMQDDEFWDLTDKVVNAILCMHEQQDEIQHQVMNLG